MLLTYFAISKGGIFFENLFEKLTRKKRLGKNVPKKGSQNQGGQKFKGIWQPEIQEEIGFQPNFRCDEFDEFDHFDIMYMISTLMIQKLIWKYLDTKNPGLRDHCRRKLFFHF